VAGYICLVYIMYRITAICVSFLLILFNMNKVDASVRECYSCECDPDYNCDTCMKNPSVTETCPDSDPIYKQSICFTETNIVLTGTMKGETVRFTRRCDWKEPAKNTCTEHHGAYDSMTCTTFCEEDLCNSGNGIPDGFTTPAPHNGSDQGVRRNMLLILCALSWGIILKRFEY